MPQRKPTFNWSLLDRKDLIKFLYLIHPEVSEKRISVTVFQKILSKHLKSKLPITVSKKLDKFTETGSVYVGGTYFSDYDKNHRRCIEISFFYNLDQKYLKLSKRGFYGICILATDTILHEIMHMRQYRRRNFKFLPDYASTAEKSSQRQEQSYLGNSDEVDAYSFNIACDLMDKFKKDERKVANYLREGQILRRSSGWKMYLRAFDFNHNHPIIRRLKKKIIKYLPNAKLGKPYKSKDWINC